MKTEEPTFIRKVYFIDRVRVAWDLAQEWISKRWKITQKYIYIKRSSLEKQWFATHSEWGEKKYAISTTIYIYGDKPEYYLHGNRLQYVQRQDWKQTGALFLEKKLQTVWGLWKVPRQHGEIWQRNADLNSAWKLSSHKDWPPTEYSCWLKYSTPVAFFVYNFKMHFKKGTPKQHKIAFLETPGLKSQCQHRYSHDRLHLTITMLVTVYSDNLEQISVHLLTFIIQANRGGPSLYKASNQRWEQREREGGFWVNVQGSKPGGYSTKHHPANCTEAWLSLAALPPR